MLVSPIAVLPASPKLIVPQLQMSNPAKELSNRLNSNTHSPIEVMKEMVINDPLKPQVFSNIFLIQFTYLHKPISTKAMRINNRYDNPFYKVVLTSLLHNSASLEWLQLRQNGWATLPGPKLTEKLKCNVTSAIAGVTDYYPPDKLTK